MRALTLVVALTLPTVGHGEEPKYQGQPLVHWFGVLASREASEKERWEAAGVLARLGPADKAALPFLVERLSNTDPENRRLVVFCLRRLGRDSIDALAGQLTSDDPDRRQAAAELLGELAPHSKTAAGDLAGLLKDKVARVRLAASQSLWQLGAGPTDLVPVWIELLGSDNAGLMKPAARHLGLAGPDAQAAVDPLVRLLKDDNDDLKRAAALALVRIDPTRDEPVKVLLEALRAGDEPKRVSEEDWELLEAIHTLGDRAVPGLIALVQDAKTQSDWRVEVAGLLADSARITPEIARTLVALLQRQDAAKFQRHVVALGRCGVAALIEALDTGRDEARGRVRAALVELGPLSRPALLRAARDGAPNAARRAAETLGLQGVVNEQVEQTLRGLLKDRDESASLGAAYGLYYLDPVFWPGMEETVVKHLSSKDATTRVRAATLLYNLRPRREETLAAVARALRDDNEDVRVLAVATLHDAGPAAKTQAGDLKRALGDNHFPVRVYAAEALSRLDPPDVAALPVLLEIFTHSQRFIPELHWFARRTDVASGALDPRRTAEVLVGMGGYTGGLAAYGDKAVPALLDLLARHAAGKVELADHERGQIFDLLGQAGKGNRDVHKLLAKAAQSPGRPAVHAATALLRLDPDDRDALAVLMDKLRKDRVDTDDAAAFECAGKAAWPELVKHLQAPPLDPADPQRLADTKSRTTAYQLLTWLAFPAPPTAAGVVAPRASIPVLLGGLTHWDANVRWHAGRWWEEALRRPNRDQLLPALVQGWDTADPLARLDIAGLLVAEDGQRQRVCGVLNEGLGDKDPKVRARAVEVMLRREVLPGPFARNLERLLDDADAELRLNVLRLLERLDRPGRSLLRRLLTLANGNDRDEVQSALYVLRGVDPTGKETGRDLEDLLTRPESKMRGEVAAALKDQERSLDALEPLVFELVRREIVRDPRDFPEVWLLSARWTPAVLPALLEEVRGDVGKGPRRSLAEPRVQDCVLWLPPQSALQGKDRPTPNELLSGTRSPLKQDKLVRLLLLLDPDGRQTHAAVLAQLRREMAPSRGEEPDKASAALRPALQIGKRLVLALASMLADGSLDRADVPRGYHNNRGTWTWRGRSIPHPIGRAAVASILGRLGEDARAAAPALRHALADERVEVRCWSAWALLEMDEHVDVALPVLLEWLQGTMSLTECEFLCDTFAFHSRYARESIPMMLRVLRRSFNNDATRSADRGGMVEPAEILGHIGQLGPAAKDAVPELRRLLKVEPASRPGLAAWELAFALARLTGDTTEAVAALKALPVDGWKARVLERVGDIGLKRDDLAALLRPALRHTHPAVRLRAAVVLTRAGARKVEDLPPLLEEAFAGGEWRALDSALEAVGRLQEEARPLLPALRKARERTLSHLVRSRIDLVIKELEKR